MTIYDAIGLLGVGAYVWAYALLQMGRLSVEDGIYLLLNAFGGVMLLISLTQSFNLASFITQLLWLIFTGVGYLRSLRAKRSI